MELSKHVIEIKNYPPNFNEAQFHQMLSPYGAIHSIKVVGGGPHICMRVQFEQSSSAMKAQHEINNMNLNGFTLRVFHMAPKPSSVRIEESLDKKCFLQYKEQASFQGQVSAGKLGRATYGDRDYYQ